VVWEGEVARPRPTRCRRLEVSVIAVEVVRRLVEIVAVERIAIGVIQQLGVIGLTIDEELVLEGLATIIAAEQVPTMADTYLVDASSAIVAYLLSHRIAASGCQ